MTSQDIKALYSMRDVLSKYGLETNRAGFISCPFHKGDREASLKVYERDFHCFGCGAGGDIFNFVMLMDQVSFRQAFEILGGRYDSSFSAQLKTDRTKQQREREKLAKEKLQRQRELNNTLIDVYRYWLEKKEPFTQAWTDCYNALQYQLYLNEYINEKR